MNRILACGAVLALLAGCSDDPRVTPPPPPSPELSLETSTLTASPASLVADGVAVSTLVVTVMGNDGKPMAGQTVALSATGEGNVLAPAEAQSDDSGLATFTLASSKAEVKTISATIAGQALPATATVTFVPGAAAKLAFRVPPSNVKAGDPIAPAVVVELFDAKGNPVTEGTPEIAIALGANPAGATLSGTAKANAAGGVASFSDLSLDKAGAGVTLVASSAGLESATSAAFDVSTGAPTRLVFKVEPSAAVAGKAIAPAIEISVQDASGNVVLDATANVAIAVATGPVGGTLGGTTTAAAAQGVAKFDDLALEIAGDYTLAATATGFAGATSATFTVSVADAEKLRILAEPGDMQVRAPFAFEVAVEDAYGNRVTGATDVVSVALIGGTGLTGTVSGAATAGLAAFAGLAIENEGANLALEVSASGLTAFRTQPFTVTDATAPAAIADFAVPTTTGTTVTARWTEVGDDGLLGNAATWELRYSTSPIDAGNFASATPGPTGTPQAPGATESVVITGLTAGTQYFVALKVTDGAGNSALAFATGTTTNCPVGYEGASCDTCAEGYRESSPGVCEDYCTNNDPCNPPPAASCNGNTAVTFPAARTCTASTTAPYFECSAPVETDCTLTGEICHEGACVADPCAIVRCGVVQPTCGADGVTLTTGVSVCERQVQNGSLVGVCVDQTTDTNCADSSKVCHAGACADAFVPAAGDLLVTELNRAAGSPASEWFEVYNSSKRLLNLAGLTVEGGSSFTVPASPPVLLAPGEYLVFGGSADPAVNGGVTVDVSWESLAPTFALDGAAPLKLSAGAVEVEALAYATVTPAVPAGTAAALSSQALTGPAHQNGWYWCAATEALSGGGKGTPGAANGDCGVVVTAPVDYCILQHPKDAGTAGAPVTVYGQIYEAGATDRNPNGNDGYPHFVAELGYGPSIQSGTPDLDAWTWVAASPNAAYVDSDPNNDRDEFAASLAPATSGNYLYGYRFSLRDPQTGALSAPVYCGRNGVVTSPTAGDFGTISYYTATADIAAARATADATNLSLPIGGALVTYVRPTVGSDLTGFFVQGDSATGPALFVAVDPSTLTPAPVKGSRVSFTITELDTVGGVRTAAAITGFAENTQTNPLAALVQEVSAATDLITALADYESELLKVTGTIAAPFASAGTGFVSAQLDTAGVSGQANLKLRLPATVRDALLLDAGCTVTVEATPMWRFNAQAQISAWDAADITSVSCPAPKVVAAAAVTGTSVVVTFDNELDPQTLVAAGTQFGINPALAVTAASLNPGNKQVKLTTATQAGGTDYTITVDGSLKDLRGKGPQAPDNSANFIGVASGGMCMPSQVVISQVYGGGGNSGAPYKRDFVELHNRSDTQTASIGDWSIQYASAAGTSWTNKVNIPAGTTIAPGGYFLVQLAGGTTGVDLPTPDLTGTINMGSSGNVALVSSTTAMSGTCPTTGVVDFIGFGTAACKEGTSAAPAGSNTTSLIRAADGCLDTTENSADFSSGAPNPRNSTTAALGCGCN